VREEQHLPCVQIGDDPWLCRPDQRSLAEWKIYISLRVAAGELKYHELVDRGRGSFDVN
jgi:hypothetical protein